MVCMVFHRCLTPPGNEALTIYIFLLFGLPIWLSSNFEISAFSVLMRESVLTAERIVSRSVGSLTTADVGKWGVMDAWDTTN